MTVSILCPIPFLKEITNFMCRNCDTSFFRQYINNWSVKAVMKIENRLNLETWVSKIFSDNWRQQIEAAKSWRSIAVMFGPQRTRDDIVRYLQELHNCRDDVVRALVDELEDFEDLIGGQMYTPKIMPLFEKLCYVDDTYTREKCVDILKNVATLFDFNNKNAQLLSLIKKLSIDSFYTSKCSASALICKIFNVFSEEKRTEALKILEELIESDIPRVRKAISKNLIYLLQTNWDKFSDIVMHIIEKLVDDHFDCVRIHSIQNIVAITRSFEGPRLTKIIIPLFLKLFNDVSWRVRYQLCTVIKEITKSVGRDLTMEYLFDKYISFFHDPEKEVVKIALKQFREFVPCLEKPIVIKQILPVFDSIANSDDPDLKEALSYSVLSVSPIVGKMQSYLNIFLVLLKDESYKTRIAILSNMQSVLEIISLQSLMDTILPVIKEMIKKKGGWKYRVKVLYFIEFFAENDKNQEIDVRLFTLVKELMKDKIFAVRKRALRSLKRLCEIDKSYFRLVVSGLIKSYLLEKEVIYRQNYIFGVKCFIKLYSSEQILELFKEVRDLLAGPNMDSQPLIRLNLLTLVHIFYRFLKEKSSKDLIKNLLRTIAESDSDFDVSNNAKFYLSSLN